MFSSNRLVRLLWTYVRIMLYCIGLYFYFSQCIFPIAIRNHMSRLFSWYMADVLPEVMFEIEPSNDILSNTDLVIDNGRNLFQFRCSSFQIGRFCKLFFVVPCPFHIIEKCHHWLTWWLLAWLTRDDYPNQCSPIVNWIRIQDAVCEIAVIFTRSECFQRFLICVTIVF